MKRPLILLLALSAFCNTVCAQQAVVKRDFQFLNTATQYSFPLGGNVDFDNSFVELPWPYVYRSRENLHELRIVNEGSFRLQNPWISINNSQFILENSDASQLFKGASNFNDSALLVWNHFTNKVIHRFYPVEGNRQGTPVELLSFYGYGICYNKSHAISKLPQNENRFYFGLTRDLHAVPDFRIGSNSALIDTDLHAFYRKYDGLALSNRSEIGYDRHLIRRTHHYGKQYDYDWRVNEYIANIYWLNNAKVNVDEQALNLRYALDPGEVMSLNYDVPNHLPDLSQFNGKLTEIASGRFEFDWLASSHNYYIQTPGSLNNLVIEEGQLVAIDQSKPATLNFQTATGFPVLMSSIYFDVDDPNTANLEVRISSDSSAWIEPTNKTVDGTRVTFKFITNQSPLIGQVYVNATWLAQPQAVKNFGYSIDFQLNRLLLPRPRIGENTIRLSASGDQNGIQVKTTFDYEEIIADVPATVTAPVFPQHGQVVRGPVNSIVWSAPTSPDSVINYEFLLSVDTLQNLPISSGFNVYTIGTSYVEATKWTLPDGRKKSSFEGGLNPASYVDGRYGTHDSGRTRAGARNGASKNVFIIPDEGLLTSDRQYYWRVRALGSDSIWGSWSQYFAFSLSKPMPPETPEVVGGTGDDVLKWRRNPLGTSAKEFEVYGSNEYLGFELSSASLLLTTSDTTVSIDEFPYAFFRVVAVDELGFRSEISPYAFRPYPYLKESPPPVYPDSTFIFPIRFDPIYAPTVTAESQYKEYVDVIKFGVSKFPSWMKYDPQAVALVGKADEETLKREFYNKGNVIEFKFLTTFSLPARMASQELNYVIGNHPPELTSLDTLLFENNAFAVNVPYKDDDVIYGDSVSFVLADAPSWLRLTVSDSVVVLEGTPLNSVGMHNLKLIAYDEYGDSTSIEISIDVLSNVLHYEKIPGSRDSLSLSFANELSVMLETGSYVALTAAVIDDLTAEIEGTQLVLSGLFCVPEGHRHITLPALIRTPEQQEINIVFDIEARNFPEPAPLLAYHPVGDAFIHFTNKECLDRDLTYTVYDFTGRLAISETHVLLPGATLLADIASLTSGLYIVYYSSRGVRNAFRFFKE